MARRSTRGTLVGNGERLRFVEGLRGVAALYVVLGHICSMIDPNVLQGKPPISPVWLQWLMAPFWYGHLAVAGFIVISGFCLQTSLFSAGTGRVSSLGRFFRRRAWRILPPYYACLALSLGVAYWITPLGKGMPFQQYLPVTSQNLAAHVLMVHNWSPDWMYKINGVLWSIAVEVQLYIVFPLLVLLLARAGRLSLLLFTTALTAAVLYYSPIAIKLYPWYLALFALGMVAAHFAYRPPITLGPRPRIALVISLPALVLAFLAGKAGYPMYVCDALLGVALSAVLYAGAVAPSMLASRIFAFKPLAGLGAISYSLYLMHHPIQQALYIYKPGWASGAQMEMLYLAAIGLPAILAGCTLFWLAFERPFMYGRVENETGSRVFVPTSLPLKTIGEPTPHHQHEELQSPVAHRVAEAAVF